MSLRNKQDLWSRQNWSQPHLQPQQISASRRSVTSALKTVQLCAGRDNRNRSGCRSTSGCMRSEFKGDLLQMEVRNLQGTRHVLSRAKRDIQQTQLIPGSSDQLHRDLKQGKSKSSRELQLWRETVKSWGYYCPVCISNARINKKYQLRTRQFITTRLFITSWR